jgi:hypothetical protein
MPKNAIRPDAVKNTHVLPDPKICCTKTLEIGTTYGDCLVKNPMGCRYAVSYGNGYHLCHHPHWDEFIRR